MDLKKANNIANLLRNISEMTDDTDIICILYEAWHKINEKVYECAPDLNEEEKALVNEEEKELVNEEEKALATIDEINGKIQAIKAYRNRTGLGLVIAKAIVEKEIHKNE